MCVFGREREIASQNMRVRERLSLYVREKERESERMTVICC